MLGDLKLHIDDASSNTAAAVFRQHVCGPTHTKGHTGCFFFLGLNIHDVCVEDVHVRDQSWIFFN